jgi:Ca-activated chloride channel family protein
LIFGRPEVLWIGVAVALLAVLASWNHARRRRKLARHLGGDRALLRFGWPGVKRMRIERTLLLGVAALAAGAAAAEPRLPALEQGIVPRPERSFVVAVDVSASMQASDVTPTRLAQAVAAAQTLAAGLEEDRLGMLIFAGTTYRLVPPTAATESVRFYLDGLVPTLASAADPGSLLTVAVREAVADLSNEVGERSIILISDGETPESHAAILREIGAAAEVGIAVHVVGVGTVEGSGMVMPRTRYQFGGQVLDASGNLANSRTDEELLRRIAEVGGGQYARADDPSAVEAIRRSFEIPDAPLQESDVDLTPWFALAALASLILEALLDVRLPRRARATAPRVA